jgi:hypothetical protein
MEELEVVEHEVVEDLLPAVVPEAPTTLFRTDDPGEIIRRATAVANELKTVLVDQKLTSTISNREHVKVEGWTLLGTLLGVFPVCVWTRKLDDGWEARVEARTLSGAVVGAAEAECLRSEKTWSSRDDYALRSMAQTRATSKALRQPLGFVVTLAGFDSTPAEEMPLSPSGERIVPRSESARVEGPKDLPVPKTWAKVTEYVSAYDEGTHDLFMAFAQSARKLQFGTTDKKEMSAEDRATELSVAGRAAWKLRTSVDSTAFPPPTIEDIRKAWAAVLDGQELAIPGEE